MTLQQIYDLALAMGIKADPRGEESVKKLLVKLKKEYEKMPQDKKKYFDKESLTNPYSDTRIHFGDPKTTVKKILVGVDTDAAEILLADRLNQKGEKIDLVIGHHPVGISLAALHDVMDLQVDAYAQIGVPINVVDALMKSRMDVIKRRIHPNNHNQITDTARLLNIPLMNLHTTWDNMGDQFMKNYLAKKSFDTVDEIVKQHDGGGFRLRELLRGGRDLLEQEVQVGHEREAPRDVEEVADGDAALVRKALPRHA
jgi:hypothetical protein